MTGREELRLVRRELRKQAERAAEHRAMLDTFRFARELARGKAAEAVDAMLLDECALLACWAPEVAQ